LFCHLTHSLSFFTFFSYQSGPKQKKKKTVHKSANRPKASRPSSTENAIDKDLVNNAALGTEVLSNEAAVKALAAGAPDANSDVQTWANFCRASKDLYGTEEEPVYNPYAVPPPPQQPVYNPYAAAAPPSNSMWLHHHCNSNSSSTMWYIMLHQRCLSPLHPRHRQPRLPHNLSMDRADLLLIRPPQQVVFMVT
jgi:hypothetical protein